MLRIRAKAVADSKHRQANVWATARRKPVAANLARDLALGGSRNPRANAPGRNPGTPENTVAKAVVRGSDREKVCATEADQAVIRGVGRAEVCVTEAD